MVCIIVVLLAMFSLEHFIICAEAEADRLTRTAADTRNFIIGTSFEKT